jgi:hypothetical protein
MKWTDTGGSDFAQAPAGTHVARCVRLIDIGTQPGEYKGEKIFRRQVVIGFELPNELMPDGERAGMPFFVSKYYTASLAEKANLRRDLVNWRGREFTQAELAGFDSKNILGKPCMLQLTPNDKNKIRITALMALPKAAPVPEQINPSFYFSLEPDEFSDASFNALSDYYKNLITSTPEFLALQATSAPPAPPASTARHDIGQRAQPVQLDDFDDDIPF